MSVNLNPDPAQNPTEPAMTVAGIASAVGALLTLLIAFGIDLSDTKAKAIIGFILIAGPIVYGAFTRGKVFSPATVAKMLAGKE